MFVTGRREFLASYAIGECCHVEQTSDSPPFRNLAFELVVLDHGAAGSAVGLAGEAGLAEGGGLGGAQREIILHEPVVIQQLRHPLQLAVDPVVEGNKEGLSPGQDDA